MASKSFGVHWLTARICVFVKQTERENGGEMNERNYDAGSVCMGVKQSVF